MEMISRGFEYGVLHKLAQKAQNLSLEISDSLGLSAEQIHFLCNMGSIYVNHRRVTDLHHPLKVNDYLRVHTKPRRFIPFETLNWQEQIIFENDQFVVANKPSGLPCHATVDNKQENLISYLQAKTGKPCFITSRLDVATSGLVVLAKNKRFQSEFNLLLAQRLVEKKYLAEVEGNMTTSGLIQHWMKNSPRAPKELISIEQPDTSLCQLEVISNHFLAHTQTTQVRIRLLTGRTHQIRAQMAQLGHPICGDSLYGARTNGLSESICLACVNIKFLDFSFSLQDVKFQK